MTTQAPSNARIATMVPLWPAEHLAERLYRCRAMLKIHGMLTEKESRACRKRIAASVKRMQKSEEEEAPMTNSTRAAGTQGAPDGQ